MDELELRFQCRDVSLHLTGSYPGCADLLLSTDVTLMGFGWLYQWAGMISGLWLDLTVGFRKFWVHLSINGKCDTTK